MSIELISEDWRLTVSLIYGLVLGFTFAMVPIIEISRLWLISYDLHYLRSSKNQQWKTTIDVSFAEKDWYLQNRGRWGSKQYVTRFAFACYIAMSTVGLTCYCLVIFTNVHAAEAIFAIFTFIPPLGFTIITLYLYTNTPHNLQDRLLFQYEFAWTAATMTFGILCVIVAVVVYSVISPFVGRTVLYVVGIGMLLPSLLSTLWIPYKVGTMTAWKEASLLNLRVAESPGSFRQKLPEILRDEQQFEALIDWMNREFCSESMLSFLEFVQFRKFVKEEMGKGDETEDSDRYDFQLYDGMPKSTIIYDPSRLITRRVTPTSPTSAQSLSGYLESGSKSTGNTLLRCKQIAHLFLKKYIEHNSEHALNISASMRNKFVDLDQREYDGMDLTQFETVYDEVIEEMLKYVHQSYKRYEMGMKSRI